MQKKVYMICSDDETAKDVGDCLKRVSAALSAVNSYVDACCELDEDADDFMDKIGPVQMRMTMTLISLYPNARQFDLDIQSIGNFTVRKIQI